MMKSLIRPAKSSLNGSTVPTHWHHRRTPRAIWLYSLAKGAGYELEILARRGPDNGPDDLCNRLLPGNGSKLRIRRRFPLIPYYR